MTLTIGVAGMDHLHLLELVQGLVDAGATTAAHVPDGELLGLYEGWRTDSVPTALPDLLADPAIELVVTAGIPSERAEVAVAALQAGKHVLTAKPGVTTLADLDRVQAAAARAGRRWTVLFTERFTNRATSEAIRLARSGAVGEVVHLVGSGPHALNQEGRPAWFFEADRSGGILADLASHQVDQFLAVTGDLGADVTHSFLGNVSCPEHPGFSDLGTLRLVGRTPAGTPVVGDHRVDLLSPAGLGTWGDVRLTIVGTEGTLEVRANVDPAGEPGEEHLIHVDGEGTRRVDCSQVDVDWAGRLVADLADDGSRLLSQDHVEKATRLALVAQRDAQAWGVST